MPTLWISEYDALGKDGKGMLLPIAPEPVLAAQRLILGGSPTEVESAAFNDKTNFVRLLTDTDYLHVAFAGVPATQDDEPLMAGVEAWRRVPAGGKVSAVV